MELSIEDVKRELQETFTPEELKSLCRRHGVHESLWKEMDSSAELVELLLGHVSVADLVEAVAEYKMEMEEPSGESSPAQPSSGGDGVVSVDRVSLERELKENWSREVLVDVALAMFPDQDFSVYSFEDLVSFLMDNADLPVLLEHLVNKEEQLRQERGEQLVTAVAEEEGAAPPPETAEESPQQEPQQQEDAEEEEGAQEELQQQAEMDDDIQLLHSLRALRRDLEETTEDDPAEREEEDQEERIGLLGWIGVFVMAGFISFVLYPRFIQPRLIGYLRKATADGRTGAPSSSGSASPRASAESGVRPAERTTAATEAVVEVARRPGERARPEERPMEGVPAAEGPSAERERPVAASRETPAGASPPVSCTAAGAPGIAEAFPRVSGSSGPSTASATAGVEVSTPVTAGTTATGGAAAGGGEVAPEERNEARVPLRTFIVEYPKFHRDPVLMKRLKVEIPPSAPESTARLTRLLVAGELDAAVSMETPREPSFLFLMGKAHALYVKKDYSRARELYLEAYRVLERTEPRGEGGRGRPSEILPGGEYFAAATMLAGVPEDAEKNREPKSMADSEGTSVVASAAPPPAAAPSVARPGSGGEVEAAGEASGEEEASPAENVLYAGTSPPADAGGSPSSVEAAVSSPPADEDLDEFVEEGGTSSVSPAGEDSAGLRRRGLALEAEGRFEAAERVYRELVRRNPRDPQGYADLAFVLRIEGRREDAAKMLEKAISLGYRPDPGLVVLLNLRTCR